jgi:alkaline phosphatase D
VKRHAVKILRGMGIVTGLGLLLMSGGARGADIIAGPMVGHVTDRSARIWLQMSVPKQVSVDCYDLATDAQVCALTTDPVGPSPFTADIPLSNLEPNKAYRIELKLDGTPVAVNGTQCVIRTFPPAGDEAVMTVAFGSGVDAHAGPAKIFKVVEGVNPRAFLFLGNTAYLPQPFPAFVQDGVRNGRQAFRLMADTYSEVRRLPELQKVFRTVPCYGAWNDGDFGGANSDRTFPFSEEAWSAFQKFWPSPDWGAHWETETDNGHGCYCTFTLGDADFFVLDSRMHRDPDGPAGKNQGGRTMLGAVQLDWLKQGLLKSTANFKVIACGSQLLANDVAAGNGGGAAAPADTWAAFQPEQGDFLKWLGANKISGVLFVTGTNRGYGELTGIGAKDSPTHYPLLELTSSSLVGKLGADPGTDAERVAGPVVENNFGTIDFVGQRDHRMVTLQLRDASGVVRVSQRAGASDLRGP